MSELAAELYESVSPHAAAALLEAGEGRVIDVRTLAEFCQHHIKGAYLLPIQELNVRHAEIPRDAKLKILIICEHGVRSLHASQALSDNGWKNIVNIQGGMEAWIGAGLPVERR